MLKSLRSFKGLLTLAFIAMLAAACSTPKYYVFKTIKHTPVEKTADTEQKQAKTPGIAAIALEEVKAEETTAVASSKETVTLAPLSLTEASAKVNQPAEAVTSKRISKLEKIKTALQVKKEVKKILKEQQEMAQEPEPGNKSKSQVIALVLALLVGYIGIHRFYLGYTTIGILQIITLGGCGIWSLIDLIRIITGDLKPADGSDYDPEL